jgi:hypothetical protein
MPARTVDLLERQRRIKYTSFVVILLIFLVKLIHKILIAKFFSNYLFVEYKDIIESIPKNNL